MAIKALQAQADGEYDGVYISYDLISRQAVIEAIYDMESLKYRIDLEKVIKELPSVAIPPEHDGCKDCVYQDNPQDAMPCRECKQNYMDKWEKAPQWIHTEECDEEFPYRCSKCNLPSRSNGHRYCPNCGSYMYGHLRKFRMR